MDVKRSGLFLWHLVNSSTCICKVDKVERAVAGKVSRDNSGICAWCPMAGWYMSESHVPTRALCGGHEGVAADILKDMLSWL